MIIAESWNEKAISKPYVEAYDEAWNIDLSVAEGN